MKNTIKMKIVKKILLVCLLLFTSASLFALGYYFAVTKDCKLNKDKLIFSAKNVVVYADNNQIASSVCLDDIKQVVAINAIPKHTQFAFVDTEDKRFFSHNGFDYKRIAKAVIANIRSASYQQGASTISQQLIKNTHLSNEKTLKRKLKEWKLTRALEKEFPKEKILEKYLNTIYFGHNCFGIASASNFYFGKPTDELTIADSAILAGLLKSPNNYSPFKQPDKCQKRKKSVLQSMLACGHITQEQFQTAVNAPLPTPKATHHSGYAHFVFEELEELAESQSFSVNGKIEIFTYLNESLQEKLVNLFNSYNDSDFFAGILNGDTNGFSACLSSRGILRRLPGSLLKPLLVYAPAIEENILSPATPILDEKTNFGGYSPDNYDGKFYGYLSARECLAKSLNVPAVKILQSIGIERATGYLKKLGLSIEKDDSSLALALGGMKNGYSMQELLSAYSALQQKGVYTKGAFIKEIKIDGNTIYKRNQIKTHVFSEETAYLTTDMLKTAVHSGTAKKLRAFPYPIACKTGTVGTNNGNTDAYAISYTTRDTAGVWLGNANNSFIEQTGGGLPCNYLLKINEFLCNNKLTDFPTPQNVSKVELDKTHYYDTHTMVLADPLSPIQHRLVELFKDNNKPQKTSDLYTNPNINPPILQFDGKKVIIIFDEKSPKFYSYKIDRYDYASHNTLYEGPFIKQFIDETTLNEKTYIYTIYPICDDRVGKGICLPEISTKQNGNVLKDKEITQKNWWEY